jgi:hypothetical protein
MSRSSRSALVLAAPVEHEAPWPAAPDGAPEMPTDVRVLRRAEDELLHGARPHARARAGVCAGGSYRDPHQSGQGRYDDGLGQHHAAAQSRGGFG